MKIRIYKSKWSQEQQDADYTFIQWLATTETVIAIVQDSNGQIFQFKLNQYPMAFITATNGSSI